jgi:hypothetical protein
MNSHANEDNAQPQFSGQTQWTNTASIVVRLAPNVPTHTTPNGGLLLNTLFYSAVNLTLASTVKKHNINCDTTVK